ncbi:class I SAM-dependent methyltransferase [Trujillonella endophytica]|uniref:Ubiquinone/menaquinone biosynthesis C-methylase UbiE n=1 Tax=Trujillonella endophytica TaxID=673521 RepID=A0A1H8T1R4_9ACTN|nr:methyltransferase domain-containing protein [Trujillella endophytica]SEO84538.1 Ubiquinone/menaquinone biosynthesis C-methylase UbiE [Trujillella endophytica]
MTTATYRHYSGTAAELYQRFFVPSIATPVSAEFLRTAALQPGARVLDVACGTGVITRAAAEQVGPTGSVTGIDLAPDMIEIAESVPSGGAPIAWQVADAASLPLPDESYDVALCQMGLMFMEDRAGALGELHRVLAPGGRVVVNTPGRIQPLFEVMERAIADNLDPHLGAFVSAVFSLHDPSVLADLLTGAGFRDVTCTEYFAVLDLPGPVEFLWNYIDLTPMGTLVAEAPEEARAAMERQVLGGWAPGVVNGRMPVEQPMALAWGLR